jgi:hypothetical protein
MFKFTQEQNEFLLANYQGKYSKELAEMFNKKFKTDVSPKQIKNFRRNHSLNCGLTGRFQKNHVPFNKGTKGMMKANKTSFKKGNIPKNYKPIGSERINIYGYVEVKIADPNKWETKNRFIYKKYKGGIPKGFKVIYADGNKLNNHLDNLILVSNSEGLIMNKRKLIYDRKELTETGHLIAKVIDKTNKMQK